ncbi:methylation-associated defense system DNA methyltransferase MAD2 [Nonomuraea sp. KM90]|uniref:methylation-associated defense system DNA methyltransferase MAD2 n=1 Tax=Nonomuraea sp. KM90 TaxID=3457428 RepID=UPI003FCC4B11
MEQVSLEMGEVKAATAEPTGVVVSLADDEDIDFITGKRIKLKGNEHVRQAVAKALVFEYRIPVEDMARDYPIPVDKIGQRKATKKADIAIFEHGKPHTLDNLRRVVICKPEPKTGRSVTKLRTFKQASADLIALEELLGTERTPLVQYGMWTNGVDQFFIYKDSGRFGASFEQLSNWPVGDESGEDSLARPSVGRLRLGEAGALKTAFRRCHNYIHGNEGMPKDAAFWQFLYLLFAKMHDEKVSRRNRSEPQFYLLLREGVDSSDLKPVRKRILDLFEEVKREYHPIFTASDTIDLSDRAIAFIVGELGSYNLSGTDADVKGLAYQELVGTNLRGDRGQYFTPRAAVALMVKILDPQEGETVLDPCCGTGGFLRETLRHLLDTWRREEGTTGQPDTIEQLDQHQDRLQRYAADHLFGADFDRFLVRAAGMSVMMLTGAPGKTFHMDSLAFPEGHLGGVDQAREEIPLGSIDVLLTNPPFGTDIKIEELDILQQYHDGVAQSWTRNRETGELVMTGYSSAMSPEQLFVQRSVQWVKEGGRIGIVLPNGILSNPGPSDESIRRWILKNCWILASIELPVEAFIYDAGVNILTTLLFLKRKTREEIIEEAMAAPQDYPVFMAVAEKVGIDRRGNTVYRRHPDGEIILEIDPTEEPRTWVRNGETIKVPPRLHKAIDNDLPEIAEAYKRFRRKYPEPGLRR